MRAAIIFLLPFLGSCRHLAPRDEVSDPKRDIFNGVSSVCYTYTTTYLTTIAAGGPIPPGATVTIPGGSPTGGIVTAIPPGQTTPAPAPGSATTIITGDNTVVLSIQAPAPAATGIVAGALALVNDTVLQKRQTAVVSTGELGYVSAGGTTGACAAARQFAVANGELIDVATGVAVAAGANLQPIDLNDPVTGTYATTFALSGGVLVWTNSAFYNGAAVFCLLDSVLYASFNAAGPPAGCTVVNLAVVQANVCQNVAVSASISLSLGVSASVSGGLGATGSGGLSASVSGGLGATGSGGVSASVPVIASISGVGGLSGSVSVPAITPTVTGAISTTGVAQSIPSATVFVAVGQAIDVDLSLLFDLLGTVASFTTTPSVSWISLGGGNNNNVLAVNVPATWTVGLNVKVELSVNLGVAQLFTYDLFLDIIAPTATTSPGVSVPAGQTVTPSVPVSVTSIAPVVTSTPISINVVQGVYYEIDLAAYLLNSGDVPQPPSTIPTNLDWVGLFDLVNNLNGLLSYDIHGTVPSDYPLGDVIVNVLVDSQVSANYALQFVLVVTQETSAPSVTLPGLTSTPATPTLGSFTSGIVLPTAPATVSINLEQGQSFDVALAAYLEFATDVVESFTTQPVVDWISFGNGGLNTSELVGTVPLEYPTGAVNVAVKVFGALEYTIPLVFNIVPGPFSITSVVPTAPSPTLPTAATSSPFISGVPAPLTTSVTVYLGQPFDIDLSALFISSADVVVDLVTSPVVDWVAVGANAETLVGTVPTVLDANFGTLVQVLETVQSAATGRTYSILVSLNIAELSGSSSGAPSVVLPTTTPNGLTSPPVVVPSTTLPSPASASSTAPNTFATDISLLTGEQFDVDLSAIAEAFGALSLDLDTFSLGPLADFISSPTLEGDGDYHLTGLVPDSTLPGTYSILIQAEGQFDVTLNIQVNFVVSQGSPSSSNTGLTTPGVGPTSSPVEIPTSTPALGSPTLTIPTSSAVSSPSLTPIVIGVPVTAGQPFTIDVFDVLEDADIDVASILDTPVVPDFVTFASTVGGDIIFTGTVPVGFTGSPVISFLIEDSADVVSLINLELDISAPGVTTSQVVIPSASQTGSSPASSASAATGPIFTLASLIPGQTFFYDVSTIVFDATGDTVISLQAPVDQTWINVDQVAGTVEGDQTISGTVPEAQALGTYIVTAVVTDAATGARNIFSLGIFIVSPSASASIVLPSSLSVPGVPLPSSAVTPTQSTAASGTTATPFATIIYLTPGQSFNLEADLLVEASGYLNVESITVTPVSAEDFISLSGTVGAQILAVTIPDDYTPGNTIVVDLLSFGDTSILGDVQTYFNVLVELVIVATTPSASSGAVSPTLPTSLPGVPSASVPGFPSASVPGVPSESIPGFPSASVPGVPSESVPGFPSASVPGFPSASVPGVPSESVPGFPSASVPGFPSASVPGVPSESVPGFPSASVPGFPSASVPGVPSESVPGFPSASVPGFPSASVPGVPSESGPGFPSASGPGFPSASVPGVPSESGPGFPSASVPGLPSESRPGFPSASGPGFPSASVPGVPSESGPGFPSASVPGLPSESGPGFPSASGPGFPSASVPGVPSESVPGFPSASVPGFPSASVPGFPSASASVPGVAPTVPSSSTASASQAPLPTSFNISPFQNFYLPLGVYLQSTADIAAVASGTVGFSINDNNELVVSPAAGLQAGAVASVVVNVSGGPSGPYTLPFTFFVLPSSFTISANQNFDIDLSGYLQAPTDTPSLSSALSGVSLSGDTVTISSFGALLAGTTFTLPIQVTGPGGSPVYTLPFTITVLPLPSASFTNLPSFNLPSASASLPSLPSFGVTPATTSGVPLPTAPVVPSCQLTGTFPTFVICNIPALRLFSLPIGGYLGVSLGAGADVGALLSTSPPVDWLSLDADLQLLTGTPPADAPATVDVVLSITLGSSTYTAQIELDINGGLPRSTIALPSVPLPSASFAPVPTPNNCRPATDNLLAVAICDVTQNAYFSLPLLGYLAPGAALVSLESQLNVALGTDVTLTWLGLSTSILSGYPPLGVTGEFLIGVLYSSGGALNTLFIEINVLPPQSTSALAAPSFTLPGPAASTTGAATLPTSTLATFIEQQGSEVDILLSSLIPALASISGVTVLDGSGQLVGGLIYDGVNSLVGTLPSNLVGTLYVTIQYATAAGLSLTIPAQIIVLPTGGVPPPSIAVGPTSTGPAIAPPPTPAPLVFSIPVFPGEDAGIDLTQYLQGNVNNVNNAVVSLANVVPAAAVDWFNLDNLLLFLDVPADATGTVSVTLNVQVSISFSIVLNFLVQPTGATGPATSGGLTILTQSSTTYSIITLPAPAASSTRAFGG